MDKPNIDAMIEAVAAKLHAGPCLDCDSAPCICSDPDELPLEAYDPQDIVDQGWR